MKFEQITGTTKIFGIIGYPIHHVMSPTMHNALLQKYKLNIKYIPFHVEPDNLGAAVAGLTALNVLGFNVTIPHKITILPFLDEIDPLAKAIGAVNTIKIQNGHLHGINTDGEGAIEALTQRNIKLQDQSVVILGAGGAARAIAFSLIKKVKNMTIINRSEDHLSNLVTQLHNFASTPTQELILNDPEDLCQAISQGTLMINTTPVGMTPHISQSPIPKKYLHQNLVVYDIIYSPLKTQLLQDAQAMGCKIINGIDMLVNQGALAFKYWLKIDPDRELMKQIIISHLHPQGK